MKNLLESYIANSPKTMAVELTIEEYEDLVVDAVNLLTGVNLDGCISSSVVDDDYDRIATYVDRVLLDAEEEDKIDVLYHNPFDYYVEPNELFTRNVIKNLFDDEAGETIIRAFDWYGNYRYQLVVNEETYKKLNK